MSIFWNVFPSHRRHKQLMATLNDLLTAVEIANTKTDSLITLVDQLRRQVSALPSLTPEQQAQIDVVFAAVVEQADEVQRALDANVPAAGPVAAPVVV